MAPPLRRGRTEPRIFTPPLRGLTPDTSLGFAVCEFAELLGIELYPWQRWLLVHLLELAPSGRLRFRTVIVIVGRQNGKSTVMKVLILWFMYVRSVRLVLGTAQDLETAEQLWAEAVEIALDDEDLAEEIEAVVRRNGAKALVLASGSRYQVKATSRRAGRGKAAQVVVLDELREHTTWAAWAAIANTTLAQESALVVGPSNAGDLSSVVLRELRRLAHVELGDPDGVFADVEPPQLPEDVDGPTDLGLFEWSAPPGSDMWDRDGWAAACPAMNYTTREGRNAFPETNLVAMARAATASAEARDEFLNECMCLWLDSAREGPFPRGAWEATLDPGSRVEEDPSVFGLDVSWDGTTAYVAWAGLRPDGDPHAEVCAARAGTDWVRPWFASRASAARPLTVVLQGKGAKVSALADDLDQVEHLQVVRLEGTDLGNATGRLWNLVRAAMPDEETGGPAEPRLLGSVSLPVEDSDRELSAVRGRRLHRMPQPLLDVAAQAAAVKVAGDGAILLDRKRSPVDISPLVAVMCAVWRVTQPTAPAAVSAYETADLMVLD